MPQELRETAMLCHCSTTIRNSCDVSRIDLTVLLSSTNWSGPCGQMYIGSVASNDGSANTGQKHGDATAARLRFCPIVKLHDSSGRLRS